MEYQGKFEKLLAKVTHLSYDNKINSFIAGLKDSIRINVQANRPTPLTMEIGLIKLFVGRNHAQRHPTTQVARPEVPPYTATNFSTHNSLLNTIKKMTPEELTKNRKKSFCFHCNDK